MKKILVALALLAGVANAQTIPLAGSTVPNGPFPIAFDTDLSGGYRVVANDTARDAIITSRRVIGMIVHVVADGASGTDYRLASDLTTWNAIVYGVTSHHALTDLTNFDDHTQYLLLNGRTGGQIAYGGDTSGDVLELRGNPQDTNHGEVYANSAVFSLRPGAALRFLDSGGYFPNLTTDGAGSFYITAAADIFWRPGALGSGDMVINGGEHLAWADIGGLRPYITSNGAGTLVFHSTGSTLFTVPAGQAIAFPGSASIVGTGGELDLVGTPLTLNTHNVPSGSADLLAVAPGSNGNVLTVSGGVWTSAAPAGGGTGANPSQAITGATAVNGSALTFLRSDSALALGVGSVDVSSSVVTGVLAAGRFPALTNDVTTTAGSLATTVVSIGGVAVSGNPLSQYLLLSTASAQTITGPLTITAFSNLAGISWLPSSAGNGTINIAPQVNSVANKAGDKFVINSAPGAASDGTATAGAGGLTTITGGGGGLGLSTRNGGAGGALFPNGGAQHRTEVPVEVVRHLAARAARAAALPTRATAALAA